MSRRVFASAVLFLLVVMMCCGRGAAAVVEGKSGDAQLLQWVDIFVPHKTQVLPKGERGSGTPRDLFASPSLVSAGGVIAAFAEGRMNAKYQSAQLIKPISSDVVAEYIDSAWEWSTFAGEVNKETWRAHTVLGTKCGTNRVGVVLRPTTTMKDNKMFLLPWLSRPPQRGARV
ncbi:trans-sialidase [Trypanosoma cruzi]|nr:trans-sialidase [Trypanosoma cruzi]